MSIMGSNQKHENGINYDMADSYTTMMTTTTIPKIDQQMNKNETFNPTKISHHDLNLTNGNNLKVSKDDINNLQHDDNPSDVIHSHSRHGGESFYHFIQGIKDDINNKDLIPIKILFFFKYATVFVLYPFLTLHLKSLGLDETEAGLNSALIPLVSIFGPPVAGIIADRIGNFKYLLAGITLVNAPLALILLLVPKARETIPFPQLMTFSFGCTSYIEPTGGIQHSSFTLKTLDNNICSIQNLSELNLHENDTYFLQCGQICSINSTTTNNLMNELQNLPILPIKLTDNKFYLLPNHKTFFIPFTKKKTNLICNQNKCSLQFFPSSSSSSSSFTSMSMSMSMMIQNETEYKNINIDELLINNITFSKFKFLSTTYIETEDNNNNNNNNNSHFININVTNPEFLIDGDFIFDNKQINSDTICSEENEIIQIRSTEITDINCTNQCLIQMNRNIFCSNHEELKVYNVALTFGLYTVFRVLLGLTSMTAFVMFEGAVLAILKEFGGDYGLQRVTATFAAIIFSPLAGVLIQVFNGFTPAFCLYGVLQIFSAILTLRIDLTFKPPAEKILGHLKEILTQIEILLFFFAIFISGTAWGYLESFFFWFLQDLGGSKILMGLTISVSGLAAIPLLIASKPIIKKFGHVNIICIGLLFYGVRLVGYSYIENPWWCLPYEALEAITASLAITAAATYAVTLSTKQTITSVQGIWGGLYFGIGRASGSLFGGYFIKWYGPRHTFQIFALMSFIGAILYFILNIIYIKKYSKSQHNAMINDSNEMKKKNNQELQIQQNNTTAEMNNRFGNGYIGPCDDLDKFTNVPLDEDTPEGKFKFDKVKKMKEKV